MFNSELKRWLAIIELKRNSLQNSKWQSVNAMAKLIKKKPIYYLAANSMYQLIFENRMVVKKSGIHVNRG